MFAYVRLGGHGIERAGVVVNPVIVDAAGAEWDDEGCLSFPGVSLRVCRAATVAAQWVGLDGAPVEATLTGFAARVFQHEIDHMDGILFTDRR